VRGLRGRQASLTAGFRLDSLEIRGYASYTQIKLAMALGDKGYYRLSQIQLRHFYQTGQKAGLREQDMESIFSDLAARMEEAIADAAALAKNAGMPESTAGTILAGAHKRAALIQKA